MKNHLLGPVLIALTVAATAAWSQTPGFLPGHRVLMDAHNCYPYEGLWVRFYTLNGHGPMDIVLHGWTPSYNFGSIEAATIRWKAAKVAGVDFVASDQYEECAKVLRGN